MYVGVTKIRLRIPTSHNLKAKRRVLNSICTRIRSKYNVAIAEVGDNDVWQMAVVGITCVSNTRRQADIVMATAIGYIEYNREDIEIVSCEQETLSGF